VSCSAVGRKTYKRDSTSPTHFDQYRGVCLATCNVAGLPRLSLPTLRSSHWLHTRAKCTTCTHKGEYVRPL
jgi:hypothetical protein